MEYGKLDILKNQIIDGKGKRNTKEFLEILIKKFAKKTESLFDITGELIYYYREQQLHSIFVPVIDEIADAIITEMPVDRNNSNYGWVDYWIKYGSTIFLIELKHSYFNITSNKFRDSSKKEWETAIKQIKSLNKVNYLKTNNENIIKIALNVITLYKSSNSKTKLDIYKIYEKINNMKLEKLHKQTYQPDFISYWIPPKKMADLNIEWEDGKEVYPAVMFIAKIL